MTRLDLPYLCHDRDRHGNERWYVRKPGRRKVRLRGEPGSPDFLRAYHDALEHACPPTSSPPDSFHRLCEAFYASPACTSLAPSTRDVTRWLLDELCRTRTLSGQERGQLPLHRLEPRHVRELCEAAGPGANDRLKALKRLCRWAQVSGHIATDPARPVRLPRPPSPGFHTWTVDEVRQFEARHPLGTRANLALRLLLYTGCRRSDVVALGRQHVRDGWLCWAEAKGAARHHKEAAVPILPELRAALDATPSGHLTFLVTAFGKPFTAAGFGNWFKRRCREAGLPHCTAHGLRKAGATIAAEAGATEHELMAIYNWESPKQAALYTRRANRRRLTGRAMRLVVPEAESPESDTGEA